MKSIFLIHILSTKEEIESGKGKVKVKVEIEIYFSTSALA
jgi:hypothetical protein